jgi:hypothetical protein
MPQFFMQFDRFKSSNFAKQTKNPLESCHDVQKTRKNSDLADFCKE